MDAPAGRTVAGIALALCVAGAALALGPREGASASGGRAPVAPSPAPPDAGRVGVDPGNARHALRTVGPVGLREAPQARRTGDGPVYL